MRLNFSEGDPFSQKAALRRSLLKARQKMPQETWRYKSDRLCAHLQSSIWLAEAKMILAYFSFRQEPDLSPLLYLPNSQRQWGFPRCVDRTLIWHLWSPEQTYQPGAYGIPEPAVDAPTVNPADVDLILVPCVACDVKGYRLGYGGGFYDRLLSHSAWDGIPTVGIVFEFARLPYLPVEPWDRPLQAICSEAGLTLPK